MQLNMKTYKGYNKLPYCNAHTPQAKHTTVADTPEARRLAENTKIQSQVKYHEEFERNMKGKVTQVADDPEMTRLKQSSKIISNAEYHKDVERKQDMEHRRRLVGAQDDVQQKTQSSIDELNDVLSDINLGHHRNPARDNVVYSSDHGPLTPKQRLPGSISDYDPMSNANFDKVRMGDPNSNMRSPGYSNNSQSYSYQKNSFPVTSMPQQFPTGGHPQQNYTQPGYTARVPQSPQGGATHNSQLLYSSSQGGLVSPQQMYQPRHNTPLGYPQPHPSQGQQHPQQGHMPQNMNPMQNPARPPQMNYPQTARYPSGAMQYPPQHQHQQPHPQMMPRPPHITQNNPAYYAGYPSNVPPNKQGYAPRPAYSPQFAAQQAPPTTPPGLSFRAMYDYSAQDTDEVSFVDGDIIIDCVPIDDGWMIGRIKRTGLRGMIPANYVEPL